MTEMDRAGSSRGPEIPVARSAWMPPRLFLAFAAGGAVAHVALGGPVLARIPTLGALVAAAGLAVMIWAARCFGAAKTTLKPYERSSVLVETGPYRFSRNPMYLGLTSMAFGLALALGTPGPWLAAAAFAATLQLRFIQNEERALALSLGAPYAAYRTRVRRWL